MPLLDLNIIPTYNKKTIAVGDNSQYEKTPVTPTLEVTVPGFKKVTLAFTPNSLNVLNSYTFGITEQDADLANLPDGIWVFKYSVNPSYENFTTLTLLKSDLIEESYATAFLKLDIGNCENAVLRSGKERLSDIKLLIEAAKANAKICNTKLSLEQYNLAQDRLDKILNCGL